MTYSFVKKIQALKKDGWSNFGKDPLSERELGFNDGVDAVLDVLKTIIRRVELNNITSHAELSQFTQNSLETVLRKRMATAVAEKITEEAFVEFEKSPEPSFAGTKTKATVYFVDPKEI